MTRRQGPLERRRFGARQRLDRRPALLHPERLPDHDAAPPRGIAIRPDRPASLLDATHPEDLAAVLFDRRCSRSSSSPGWTGRWGIAATRELWARHLVPFLVFGGNWSMALLGPVPYDAISILWSVCVEEQFYLFCPLADRLRARESSRAARRRLDDAGHRRRGALTAMALERGS